MRKTKAIKKPVNVKANKPQEHKCDLCDFKGKTQVKLNKHMNTKHCVNVSSNKGNEKDIELKCSLCEKKLNSENGFQEHISEHLEEIELIDIKDLINYEDMFECNLCSFESGNENSIKEHLIEHVMVPKVN